MAPVIAETTIAAISPSLNPFELELLSSPELNSPEPYSFASPEVAFTIGKSKTE